MSEKLISEKWLCEYLDGYDVGALVKGDLGAFTMLNNFRVALMEAPAVDAVEVVRCKECFYHKDSCFAGEGNIYCDVHMKYFPKDGFCSSGERREENAEENP